MTLFEKYKRACGNADIEEIDRLTIEGLKEREPHIVDDVVESYFVNEEHGDLETVGEIRGMLRMVGLEHLVE